ncbi:histamine H2 receptor-like [Amphiura filiformis]|uniref:histamine H2 receptor-like n=1 Tax=Amphiura filiformis TaxID=82378 RepID=UPI003B21116D
MNVADITTPFSLAESSPTQNKQPEHYETPLVLLLFKSTIAVTSLLANSLCLVVLRRVRELNPVTKAFMVNMTISDLCIDIFICGPAIGAIIQGSWPYGEIICNVQSICNIVFITASMTSLLILNLERYIAVTRSFDHPHLVTLPRAYATIFLVWIVSCSMGTLAAVLPGRFASYLPEFHTCVFGPKDTNKMDIIGIVEMCLFVILITITLILFVQLFLIARLHAKRIADLARATRMDDKTQRKSFITFFLMTICLAVCYTPLGISICYENIRKELPVVFVYIADLLYVSNGVLNVMIYYARNAIFRQTTMRLFRECLTAAQNFARNTNTQLRNFQSNWNGTSTNS